MGEASGPGRRAGAQTTLGLTSRIRKGVLDDSCGGSMGLKMLSYFWSHQHGC
jgi:hypothetical protein